MPTPEAIQIITATNNALPKEHFPSHFNPQQYQTVNGQIYIIPTVPLSI